MTAWLPAFRHPHFNICACHGHGPLEIAVRYANFVLVFAIKYIAAYAYLASAMGK
jgi:hypothetical protein